MGEKHTPGILKCLWDSKVRFYKSNLARSRCEAKAAEEELEMTLNKVKTVSFYLLGKTTIRLVTNFFPVT